MTARSHPFVIAAVVLLAIASFVTPASAQGPLPPVRVNEVFRTMAFAPLYVAIHKGFFKEEGVTFASFVTTPGAQATITEVVSGGSDIALSGPEQAAFTIEAGPDKRLVNFAQLTGTDGTFIVSKTPMRSFDMTALKGKTILTSGAGSSPALVLQYLLKKAGVDPKKDVTIQNIPVTSNMPAAFKGPEAQFAQVVEPMTTLLVREGVAHRVAFVGDLLGPVPYTTFMATANYISRNPGVIQGFTNAIYKAQLWIAASSAEEVATVMLPSFQNVDAGLVKAVVEEYKRSKKAPAWAANPLISREGMDFMLNLALESGAIKRKPSYESVVDPSFAEKAIRSIKR